MELNETSNTEVVVEQTPPVVDESASNELFNDFVDEGGDETPVEAPPTESTPTPEGAPAHAAPDGETGVPPTVIPPGTAVVPPTPPAPVAPTVVPGAVAPVAPPVQVPGQSVAPAPQDMAQMRENLVTEIATRYAMPEAVKDEFMMNPEKVLPVFAARLYVDIYDAVINTVMAQIPQVMGAREQQVAVQRTVENKFFEKWPNLKEPTYQRDIASVARAYRQQNPQATLEQTVEAVGAMVSVMKGVPLPGQPGVGATSPQARPPIPAGVGASRAPVPAAPQANLFEEIFTRD